MTDAALTAACQAYLVGRGLPAATADVAALAAFVEAQAPRLARPVRHEAEPSAVRPGHFLRGKRR